MGNSASEEYLLYMNLTIHKECREQYRSETCEPLTAFYVDTNEFGKALIKNAFPNSLVFCHLQFALFCPLSKPTQKTLQTEMKMDAIIIRKFCFAWKVTGFQSSLIFLLMKGSRATNKKCDNLNETIGHANIKTTLSIFAVFLLTIGKSSQW